MYISKTPYHKASGGSHLGVTVGFVGNVLSLHVGAAKEEA